MAQAYPFGKARFRGHQHDEAVILPCATAYSSGINPYIVDCNNFFGILRFLNNPFSLESLACTAVGKS
jgi:hypothetical protein